MKHCFLLAITLCFSQLCHSQTPFCGSDWLPADPTVQALHQQLEQQAFDFFSAHPQADPDVAQAVLTIPVVVHIIHNGGPENISDTQVQQGMTWLNAAYANAGYFDQGSGTDVGIQFCLAQRSPDGLATNGITRNQSPLTTMTQETQDLALKNISRWNPKHYLNIWLVRDICSTSAGCGVVGYAYGPPYHGTPYDGLLIEAQFFGAVQSQMSVAAHELGHYLGLYHTFEGSCTNNNCLIDGDRVCDTPPDQSTAAVPCGQSVNTCTTDAQSGLPTDQPDMTSNYLDYGDISCFHDFTPGQAARMNFHLDGIRHSLLDSKGCLPPCATPTVSAFTASATTVAPGQAVTFTNTSQNAGTYQWSVNGQPFSSAANPTYTFATTGTYTVTLLAQAGNAALCDAATSQSVVIQVVCAVVANFSLSNQNPAENEAVLLNNTSQNATIFSWTVNGVVQGATLPMVTFPEAGVYTIQLTAGNGVCQSSVQQEIFVRDSCAKETFQKRYGHYTDAFSSGLYASATLSDGSIVFTGSGYADSSGVYHGFYMVKIQADGSQLWIKTIDVSVYNGNCYAVAAAPDGGFAVGLSGDANASCYVAKYSAAGELEWMQGIQGIPAAVIHDVKINAEQEILVLGYGGNIPTQGLFFAKFGPLGNPIWSKGFASPIVGEQWEKIAAMPDGGLIGVGRNNNGSAQVVRLNADGFPVWRKRMIHNGESQFRDIVVVGDGSAFICGTGPYGSIMLVRINADGEVKWSKLYTHYGLYTDIQRMILVNGGLTLVGRSVQDPYVIPPVWRAFEARFDTTGTLLWNRSYLHGTGGVFNDLTSLPDGGYLVVGNIVLNNNNQTAGWLLKTDAFGLAGSCPVESVALITTDITVYQNPQNYGSFGPFSTIVASFPVVDLLVTPILLCEKACPTTIEICNNNLDDDGDGLFDCLDADCPCAEDVCRPARNNYWYFGKQAGLDFSTEPPAVLHDGQTNSLDASATISDQQGNLLFYTDGFKVYNRFHQVMPNGVNPHPLVNYFRVTSIIIPHPGNPALYYVFIHDQFSVLYYTLVDMRLHGGKGDIDPNIGFSSLTTPDRLIVGISAVRSCTFNGYWLAVQDLIGKAMLAYRIDQNGLQNVPILSPTADPVSLATEQMKFSPQGKQLARVMPGNKLVLYAFDLDFAQSGRFTNPQVIQLPAAVESSRGVEYSPTGRYLYVSSRKAAQSCIYQFDLEAGDAAAIANSATVIDTVHWAGVYAELQLTPNGKIYVSNSSTQQIDIVHRPDAPGLACQFQKSGVDVAPNAYFSGFSNCIASDFRQVHVAFQPDAKDSVCTLNSPVSYQIKNVACDVDSIRWSLVGLAGTIISNYQYANVTYWSPGQGQLLVTAFTACGQASDTLPVTVHAPFSKILNLGPDRTVCDNGVFTFHAGGGFAKYRWQNGSTDSVLTTLLPGKYWVDVYDACGSRQTDTVVVNIAPASVLALGPDRMQCAGLPITFQRPPAFASWQWSPDAFLSCDTCAGITVDPATTTTWTVLAQTADGCLSLDTLHWSIVDTLFSMRDTTVCVGQTLEVYGLQLPADTTAYFLRPSLGPGCDTLVTVQVLGLETPATTVQAQICAGQFFDFRGTLLPPDTSAIFRLPGAGCDSVVTVVVSAFPPILITLPADSTLSIGASLTLPAAATGTGSLLFQWQPGTGLDCPDCLQPLASPLDTMTYTLLVTDGQGCSARDSITLRVNPDCQLIIPNAFTPNGDGINDWFYPITFPCIHTVRLWRVINRWGQVVFERRHFAPNQQDLGWDGQQQGKAAPSDILIWMAELEYFDGRVEQHKGEVTLLR